MNFIIRNARSEEFTIIGKLMVDVYSQLDGFPKEEEQPEYYNMLRNIGELTAAKPKSELIVAVTDDGFVCGAVVYFSDMKYYGSGGTATSEKNAGGFRLLAVDNSCRGQGIGKELSVECIRRSRDHGNQQVIIHSTKAMEIAWRMYEKLGFVRSEDLDFIQVELPVFGFRYYLNA